MKSSVSERKQKNQRGGGLSTACVFTYISKNAFLAYMAYPAYSAYKLNKLNNPPNPPNPNSCDYFPVSQIRAHSRS